PVGPRESDGSSAVRPVAATEAGHERAISRDGAGRLAQPEPFQCFRPRRRADVRRPGLTGLHGVHPAVLSARPPVRLVFARVASQAFAVVANDLPAARWSSLCASGCGSVPRRERISDISLGVNDLSFRAAVSTPAVLVVSDAMADGWRAFVDGVEQPIFRANV